MTLLYHSDIIAYNSVITGFADDVPDSDIGFGKVPDGPAGRRDEAADAASVPPDGGRGSTANSRVGPAPGSLRPESDRVTRRDM